MHRNNNSATAHLIFWSPKDLYDGMQSMKLPKVALRKVVQPLEKLRLPEITVSPMPSPTMTMLVFFFLTSTFSWYSPRLT